MQGKFICVSLLLFGLLGSLVCWARDAEEPVFPPDLHILERDASGWFMVIEKHEGSGIYAPWLDEAGEKRQVPFCGEVMLNVPDPSPVFDLWAFWREDPAFLMRVGSGQPLIARPCTDDGRPGGGHLVLLFAHQGQVYDLLELGLTHGEIFAYEDTLPIWEHSVEPVPTSWGGCGIFWSLDAAWQHPDVELLPEWAVPTGYRGGVSDPPPRGKLSAFSALTFALHKKKPPDQRRVRQRRALEKEIQRREQELRSLQELLPIEAFPPEEQESFRRIRARRRQEIEILRNRIPSPETRYWRIHGRQEELPGAQVLHTMPEARTLHLAPKGAKQIEWSLRNALRCDKNTWRISDSPSQVLEVNVKDSGYGSYRLREAFPRGGGRIAPNGVLWKLPACLEKKGALFMFRPQPVGQNEPLEPVEGDFGSFTWIGPKPLVPLTTGQWHLYMVLPRTGEALSLGFLTVTETGYQLDPDDDFLQFCPPEP